MFHKHNFEALLLDLFCDCKQRKAKYSNLENWLAQIITTRVCILILYGNVYFCSLCICTRLEAFSVVVLDLVKTCQI